MGLPDTTTLHYTTHHYTTLKNVLVQYTTVNCSITKSQLLKQSEQTKVVSLCQIRYKTISEPTLNILIYTT